MASSHWIRRFLKTGVFIAGLVPVLILGWDLATDNLSANPIDDITDATGTWTLRFLLLTLAITPLRQISGWNVLSSIRRMLGLFAFFYVCLHFTTYIWLDKFFVWEDVLQDIGKRPFITVGFMSFLLLIPLAATSWTKIMKWMGGKKWKLLHRFVYIAAIGGVIHYLWLVKADKQRPLIYGALLALLLGYRIWDAVRKRIDKRRSVAVVPSPSGNSA